MTQSQAVQPGGRQDQGVQPQGLQLFQAGVHVAPQGDDLQVGPPVQELHPAPQAAGADAPARRDFRQAGVAGGDEGVAIVFPGRHRPQHQPRGDLRRHVLEAVHRQINPARQQGLFDLLDEQALAAHLGQRHVVNDGRRRS